MSATRTDRQILLERIEAVAKEVASMRQSVNAGLNADLSTQELLQTMLCLGHMIGALDQALYTLATAGDVCKALVLMDKDVQGKA